MDRFARDRYDSAHYKNILKKNGVRVVSATEPISAGPEGIILESMLEGMAEYYSAELAEKIRRGQKDNALKCRNNGGPPPFGYVLVDHHLQIDPVTAPVALEIFKRYAEGATLGEIIEDLNRRGIKTRKGREFKYSSFNAMLKNRAYIGEFHYSDTVIPDRVPAIVPQEIFDRVQMRREKNKRAPAAAKAFDTFLLTTKLFCGKCGRMMVGDSGTSWTGKVHYYYKCGDAKRKRGCDKKADVSDEAERQRLIDCFVNSVFVYDDKIVPTFNYKDRAKTIALDNVNSSDMVGSRPPRIEDLRQCKSSFLFPQNTAVNTGMNTSEYFA